MSKCFLVLIIMLAGLLSGFKEKKDQVLHGMIQVDKNLYIDKTEIRNVDYRNYVYWIKKYKSVDHLLHAFAIVLKEIPQAKLVIIGEGDGKIAFQQLASKLRIDHATTFTGFLPLEQKVILLNQMQVVVNTSAKEGWGLTVTEANACGAPAIASDVPGLRDAVKDGESGILYEYGNIEQLAEKILLLLRDERLRFRLSTGALEYAQSLTWDKSAQIMIEVIEKVTSKK